MTRAAATVHADQPAPLSGGAARRTVSVVMVVYHTGEALAQSLACVVADPQVDEFVIVDNGSSPAEEARLADLARDPKVSVISGQGNVGFARAANLGAARARGDLLVFLNPDAFLQPGCIGALATEVGAYLGMSLVGGRILNADRTEQRGGRRGEVTPVSALLSLSGLSRARALHRFEVHHETDALPGGAVVTPTVSGACFCMRRADFAALGGFDESFFLHVEDIDLCWRVRRAGGQVLFHPRAEVVHIGGTSRSSPLKVEFHKGVGLARFFIKRADNPGQWLAAAVVAPLVVIAAVLRPLLWKLRGA